MKNKNNDVDSEISRYFDSMELRTSNLPAWQITDFLGEGRCGRVYKIERTQEGITESAAIKVISIPNNKSRYDSVRTSLEGEEEADRYLAEMMNHIEFIHIMNDCPNIVSIYDWRAIEKENGSGWYIFIYMELLTPLREQFRSKPVTETDVIKLGKDICTALERCDRVNIIHGDIKPDNILVDKNGDYKLADLGMGRLFYDDIYDARDNVQFYMPPEINKKDCYNRTADIYSLGIIMYELLSGFGPAFTSENKSGLSVHRALITHLDGVPLPEPEHGTHALKKIVLKACEYNMGNRYRSAGEMRRDLEIISGGTYPSDFAEQICQRCGYSNPAENIFCCSCGSRLEEEDNIRMPYESPFPEPYPTMILYASPDTGFLSKLKKIFGK